MGKRIRQEARMRPCAVRLLGCRNEVETVVFAHAPCVDKGMGIKSPDFWGAFACHHCHDMLDGRQRGYLTKAEMDGLWMRGIYETQKPSSQRV